MPASSFPGFPAEGLDFLRKLERNNKREWFQPRKETFDTHVKAPMAALVEEINRALARFAPEYITDPGHAIYRIYRDTRFSSDKTPYKTHIAASFRKRGYDKHAAGGLYFSVSHKEIEIAGGVYMPGPEQLLIIRQYLAENHVALRKLTNSKKIKDLLGDLQGDTLTRVPKGFEAGHPAEDLIRKKQWFYYKLLDPAIAPTPDLLPAVVDRFRALLPVVEYFNTPLKPKKVRPEEILF